MILKPTPYTLYTMRSAFIQYYKVIQISPQSTIVTRFEVLPFDDPHLSISRTTFIPDTTWPNTTCFPSNQAVFSVQIKNWLPLVLGPELAIDKVPYFGMCQLSSIVYVTLGNLQAQYALK